MRVLILHFFCMGFTNHLTGLASLLMSLSLEVEVASLMLYWSLPISSEVPIVKSLRMKTLLSALLVIIKVKILLCSVALFMSMG